MDGNLASGYDTVVNWVDAWNESKSPGLALELRVEHVSMPNIIPYP